MLTGRKRRLFWSRAILLGGALLCLCVSESSGLRLLPLPATGDTFKVQSLAAVSGDSASRTPTPNREPSPYLQMVTGSQYRARDRNYCVQVATHAPAAAYKLQSRGALTTPETYSPIKLTTGSRSIPAGRAPPRFA